MRFRFWRFLGWLGSGWRHQAAIVAPADDPRRLVRLALEDRALEVRLAAARALASDEERLHVVNEASCEQTRLAALEQIRSVDVVKQCGQAVRLPTAVRAEALRRCTDDPTLLGSLLREDPSEEIRALACSLLPAEARADLFADPSLPKALRLAILQQLFDDRQLGMLFERESDSSLREAILERLTDTPTLCQLFQREEDPALRRRIANRVKREDSLVALLQDEPEAEVRVSIVDALNEEENLAAIARSDLDPRVRRAAANRLCTTEALLDIALHDNERRVRLAAVARLPDDESRSVVASVADDEQVRAAALAAIESRHRLESLTGPTTPVDVHWQAARRLDQTPVDALLQVRSDWVLSQAVRTEKDLTVRSLCLRLVQTREALETLAAANLGPVQDVATSRLAEFVDAVGIRFVPIPGRPYAISAFPITNLQFRTVLGMNPRWDGEDEMPATGMTPQEAERFCRALAKLDGTPCRLPSPDEWRHAVLADQATWFRSFRVGTADSAEVARVAVHLEATSGPRPLRAAWPNPWGLFDAIGNVAVWVEDDTADPKRLEWAANRDTLAAPEAADAAGTETFGVAAGFCWSDKQVRMDRSDRVVRLAGLDRAARDRVGLRILRTRREDGGEHGSYRLTLHETTRWGLSREQVTQSIVSTRLFTLAQMENFWRVAPVVLTTSSDYETLRPMKRRLALAGACVSITT